MFDADLNVDDVFGISRDVPKNYVIRSDVDNVFVENLARDRHIVIHGSSKQGKTSLRKYHLLPDDYILVSCLNTWSIRDLFAAILKKAGYQIDVGSRKTTQGRVTIQAELGGKLGIPLISQGEAKGGVSADTGREVERAYQSIEVDLGDVNDFLQALENIKLTKYIVLEDFHYLPQDTQRNFAFNLKAIHENSRLVFIIIGVWRETNRLIALNGDLNNRVISINADAWSEPELKEVITRGANLLNIEFDEAFSTELVKSCFESVYLVQEACAQVCKNSDVFRAQAQTRQVGAGQGARDIVKSIVDQQQDRYLSFLITFSEGHQHSALQMYKWLLLPIILSKKSELENGLPYNLLSRIIRRYHPQGSALNPGNLTQALQACVYLQTSKNLIPVIFDYDTSVRKVRVVDRSFLIWLEFQDRRELLEELNLPPDATATP